MECPVLRDRFSISDICDKTVGEGQLLFTPLPQVMITLSVAEGRLQIADSCKNSSETLPCR